MRVLWPVDLLPILYQSLCDFFGCLGLDGGVPIEDDDGNVGWSRFRGSTPDLDGMVYPAIGTALLADSCTWSCARAVAALKAQDGWP